MPNVKILLVSHKPFKVPKGEYFVPIHAGRSIAMEKSKDGKIDKEHWNNAAVKVDGVEAKDFIVSLHALDIETGEIVGITNAECEYGYRQSRFKKDWKNRFIITDVTYQLSTTFTPHLDYGNIRKVLEEKGISCNIDDGQLTAQLLRDTIIDIRNAKLPDYEVEGNAGSFFMNPIVSKEKLEELLAKYPNMPYYPTEDAVKLPAGWLIDQCGWKGKTLGRAGVHDKQALVLVNKGGATGEEVVALCRQIQKDVLDRFGVEIHPEVNIV